MMCLSLCIPTAADTLPAHLKMSSRLLTRFVYFTLSVTFVMYFNGRNLRHLLLLLLLLLLRRRKGLSYLALSSILKMSFACSYAVLQYTFLFKVEYVMFHRG